MVPHCHRGTYPNEGASGHCHSVLGLEVEIAAQLIIIRIHVPLQHRDLVRPNLGADGDGCHCVPNVRQVQQLVVLVQPVLLASCRLVVGLVTHLSHRMLSKQEGEGGWAAAKELRF